MFVPVYNEEPILKTNIAQLGAYLGGCLEDYEILIGSNGSTDRTVEIGRDLEQTYRRVAFFHLENKGVGSAFREGLVRAAGNRFITVDADLTTGLDFIPRAEELLDEYHVVVGSKQTGQQQRSMVRILGSGSFILAARILLGLPFVDYSIGSKGWRRDVVSRYQDCIDTGSAYVIEMICRAWRDGSPMIQIPVTRHDTRPSKFNLVHEGFYRFGKLSLLRLKRFGSRRTG